MGFARISTRGCLAREEFEDGLKHPIDANGHDTLLLTHTAHIQPTAETVRPVPEHAMGLASGEPDTGGIPCGINPHAGRPDAGRQVQRTVGVLLRRSQTMRSINRLRCASADTSQQRRKHPDASNLCRLVHK